MPTLMLNRFGYPNIEIPSKVLDVATFLCDNFIKCELDKAKILKSILNASVNPEYPIKTQKVYRSLVKLCFFNYTGLAKSVDEQDLATEEQITIAIKSYIEGCEQEDAFQAQQIKNVFNLISSQSTINLDFLATFFYLLTIHLKLLMQKTDGQQKEFEILCKNLLNLLRPFVMPYPDLKKIYDACQNNSSEIESTEAYVGFSPNINSFNKLTSCLQKINIRLKKIQHLMEENTSITEDQKIELLQILRMPAELDVALKKENSLLMEALSSRPILCDCCTINLENYRIYNFSTFYEFAIWYKQLNDQFCKYKDLYKKNIQAEILALQQEAADYIQQAQDRTAQTRSDIVDRSSITAVMAKLEEDYQFSITPTQLENKLNSLSKKHLEVFRQILYVNKELYKLTFSDVENAILALGGKVDIFDGSKTRILFPGGHTTSIFKVYGGLHKPHKNATPLDFPQLRLIAKALERAGINKEQIESALVEKSAQEQKKKLLPKPASSRRHRMMGP